MFCFHSLYRCKKPSFTASAHRHAPGTVAYRCLATRRGAAS